MKLITTYAKALYFSTKKNKISNRILGEELLLTRALFISSKTFQKILKNPTYREEDKLKVILTIFPGLSSTLKALLLILTKQNNLYLLPEISDEYNKILLKIKNAIRIKITTSTPFDEKYGSLLLEKFKTITKTNEILLSIAYNPKLLGGFILQYNSLIIDATDLKEFSSFFTEI